MTLPKGTNADTPLYAKWIHYSVGDVLLNDGSFVPYSEITSEQVNSVVGVVYCLDQNNAPMGVVGLQNTYNKAWAPQGTTGYTAKFESISCTYSGSSASDATFSGDLDGSDNWAYICSIDPEGAADAATNYPAFNYVNNYASTAGLTETDYEDGWYMPSLAELCTIYNNKETINNALNTIKTIKSDAAELLDLNFWSSSSIESNYQKTYIWALSFVNGGGAFSNNDTVVSNGVLCVRSAKPVFDYRVIFTASGGPSATVQTVQSGSTATEPTMPQITDYTFGGWYSDSSYTTPFDFDTPITNHTILYGKWTHNTPSLTVLPLGTDGTAGTSATYAYFGEWPQTIKADDVTIDETTRFSINDFECYAGSDGYVYVKCTETIKIGHSYTYSNGITIDGNSPIEGQVRYFKIEPIKWRVITQDYNSSGKALLLAENVLTGGIPYYNGENYRTINEETVYANNYKYSTVRAYLNGAYELEDTQSKTYEGKGFLQTAFDSQSQSMIARTNVDNSAASTADTGGECLPSTEYACANTNDKIFLLSLYEATTADYGFGDYDVSLDSRIRMSVDYSQANSTINDEIGTGGGFYLRSPVYNMPEDVRTAADGEASYTAEANYVAGNSVLSYGIVPAFTIALENVDYTVQFNSNGGSDVSSQTIATGQTATEPATAPTKDGYSFAGWYSDVGLTTQFNFSTPITNHTILYAKWNYAVGTLLLNDGTFVAYSAASPFTTDQIQNAVGIVIDFNSSGAPKTVLGLKHGSSLAWAAQSGNGYNTKFEDILCTITEDFSATAMGTFYVYNIQTMNGDESGNDNWSKICASDSSASANAETDYPAFDYANKYGTTTNLSGDYASGWFIPSFAELRTIYDNYTQLSQVISAINTVQSGAADAFDSGLYWSSSQAENGNNRYYAWAVQFSNGQMFKYMKKYDSSVCCIHTIQ